MRKDLLVVSRLLKELETRPGQGLCRVEMGLKWDPKRQLAKAYKLGVAHLMAQ